MKPIPLKDEIGLTLSSLAHSAGVPGDVVELYGFERRPTLHNLTDEQATALINAGLGITATPGEVAFRITEQTDGAGGDDGVGGYEVFYGVVISWGRYELDIKPGGWVLAREVYTDTAQNRRESPARLFPIALAEVLRLFV